MLGIAAGPRALAGKGPALVPFFSTSHQSGEVSMGSFCRLPGTSGCFPGPLSALEEHNFLFQLRAGEQPPPGAKEVPPRVLAIVLTGLYKRCH